MILLDTHVWLWLNDAPHLLSQASRRAIGNASAIGVSPLSCWELSLLERHGRIGFDRGAETWIRQALAADGIRVADLHPAAAVAAAQLDESFPRDPIDRLLYTTAVELAVPLVTKDSHLRAADPRRTLW